MTIDEYLANCFEEWPLLDEGQRTAYRKAFRGRYQCSEAINQCKEAIDDAVASILKKLGLRK